MAAKKQMSKAFKAAQDYRGPVTRVTPGSGPCGGSVTHHGGNRIPEACSCSRNPVSKRPVRCRSMKK